jgi:hypothetical protein
MIRWLICPDGEKIEKVDCLKNDGCRLGSRCATLPYLRAASDDRPFKGVSPSMAGNGARMIWLKATTEYAINPMDRVWAVLGTGTHSKLGLEKHTIDVIAEECFGDGEGTADLLVPDEDEDGKYILFDNKVWGSYKVAKSIGITMVDTPTGETYKSGEKKGLPKTRKEPRYDPSVIDLRAEELQLSRYAMAFEKAGFPISKIQLQVLVRDGNTAIAKARGIDFSLRIIPLNRLPDDVVTDYYATLSGAVKKAFLGETPPLCGEWERWEGRRCEGYCDVKDKCEELDAR